jgi:hypothetical protein
MPFKDPEKRKKTNREFIRNKTINNPEWAESERIRKKELMEKKRKDPEYNKILQKRSRMNKWKNSMKYWGTWEELDEIYMNTEICPLCNCKLSQENNSFQKSVDHDHFSKYVRDIICKNCNNRRGKVDRNKMFLHLELYRYFNRQ